MLSYGNDNNKHYNNHDTNYDINNHDTIHDKNNVLITMNSIHLYNEYITHKQMHT